MKRVLVVLAVFFFLIGMGNTARAIFVDLPAGVMIFADGKEVGFVGASLTDGIFSFPRETFSSAEYEITVSGSGKFDPSLASGIAVVDFGAPSFFDILFEIPILLPAGPNTVNSSIVGGLTDFTGNGVTITPIPPLFLTPGLGTVLTSNVAVGGPFFPPPVGVNMGVDVGLIGGGGPGPAGAFYVYGPFAAGPIPGPLGPWVALGHEYAFSLSGGGDIAALTGFTQINAAPEPVTILFLGSGLLGLAGFRRKFKKG